MQTFKLPKSRWSQYDGTHAECAQPLLRFALCVRAHEAVRAADRTEVALLVRPQVDERPAAFLPDWKSDRKAR